MTDTAVARNSAHAPPSPPNRHSSRTARRVLALIAAAVTGITLVATGVWAGSTQLSMVESVRAAFGDGPPGAVFIVQQLRLPRVLTAISVGAALAVSGLFMQGLLRNPLGSPDILGVNALASLGAILAISSAAPPFAVMASAATGALLAALALNWVTLTRRLDGARLILVGIGVQAVGSAATTLAITRMPAVQLGRAQVWLSGSLHASNYRDVTVAFVGAVIVLTVGATLVRQLAQLELGEDTALTTGVQVGFIRLALLTTASVAAGAAVSVAGPIAFVALGAPHLARRLTGPTSAMTFACTAVIGASVVLAADQVGQILVPTVDIAAGVVTAAVGAPYLLWILHRTGRGKG